MEIKFVLNVLMGLQMRQIKNVVIKLFQVVYYINPQKFVQNVFKDFIYSKLMI